MTSIQTTSDDSQPCECSISNRTLILSAASKQVLAVLDGPYPLLLPPGTVLQFGDPPGEFVVTRVRVIVGEGGGTVCAEAEPQQGHYRASEPPSRRPMERPVHLRPVPTGSPWWSQVRPGNG
jgi:hypothetical protein